MATTTPILVKVMPVIINLPAKTRIHLKAFTNAGYKQRITLELPNLHKVFEGNGEDDHPIGDLFYNTPDTPVQAKVTIENDGGNGHWHPSKMMKVQTHVQTLTVAGVLSEDAGDQDFNDAVLLFTWWTRL